MPISDFYQRYPLARTSRRPGAVDLRKVRRWFDGEGTANDSGGDAGQGNSQTTQDNPASSANGDGNNRIEDLPQWAQTLIRETRDEAAQRRIALREEQEAARKREQARLTEEGKFKELAMTREQEIAELAPYKTRTEELEAVIRKSNEAQIAQVPEDMRGLIPTEFLAPEQLARWLTANADRLRKAPAPNIDAGAGGGSGGGQSVRLTADELAMAKVSGMTPEQYAAQKKQKPTGA